MITAPFDGVVGLRKVSVGDFVDVGDDIVNLEQIDPLKVDFRVAESYLGAVRPGQRDRARRRRLPGPGLHRRGLRDRPADRRERPQHPVCARGCPTRTTRCGPGCSPASTLVLNEREDAIQVPEQALVPQGQDQFVFKVVDGKAALTKVEIGIRRDGMVEIVDGLGPERRGGDRRPAQAPRRRARSQPLPPQAGGLSADVPARALASAARSSRP